MVAILLAEGFEEMEAVTPCDLLRRAGIDTWLVGVGGKTVVGSHGIAVAADRELADISAEQVQTLVLPGGLRGVNGLLADERVLALIRAVHAAGNRVAAICAAPTILARLGITDGKRATCYPGMEKQMGAAKLCALPAVTDDTVITGEAAGSAIAFGIALIRALKGEAAARKVAQGIVWNAN